MDGRGVQPRILPVAGQPLPPRHRTTRREAGPRIHEYSMAATRAELLSVRSYPAPPLATTARLARLRCNGIKRERNPMRPFHLDSSMKTMTGVFYPTGWMVLMFPGEQQARDAANKLEQSGIAGGDVLLMTPEDIRRDLMEAKGDENILPSAGTEGDTVRKFAEFARQGHYGLMVHAPKAEDSDRVTELLRGSGISYGQKYRHLVIEDIVA